MTFRATSMADTNIDAIKKQKKAEYDRQYRLKRKLQMQQQASTSSETHIKKKSRAEYMRQYRLKRTLEMHQQVSAPSEKELARKRKKSEYNKQYQLKRKLQMQQAKTSSAHRRRLDCDGSNEEEDDILNYVVVQHTTANNLVVCYCSVHTVLTDKPIEGGGGQCH